MTNEFENEGLMERPREEKRDKVSESPRIEQKPTEEAKIPGRLYVEGNERVAYTPQGRKVIFGTSEEGMIQCEIEYLRNYPDLRKQIYGEAPKEKPKETPQLLQPKENSNSRLDFKEIDEGKGVTRLELSDEAKRKLNTSLDVHDLKKYTPSREVINKIIGSQRVSDYLNEEKISKFYSLSGTYTRNLKKLLKKKVGEVKRIAQDSQKSRGRAAKRIMSILEEKTVSDAQEKVADEGVALVTKYYKCNRPLLCDATFEKELSANEHARFCPRCGEEGNLSEMTESQYRGVLKVRAKKMSEFEPGLGEKLEEKVSVVGSIAAELGEDLGSVVTKTSKKVAKGALKVACKASYPFMGNLSANLQTRFENLVGKENYNAINATKVTIGTNFLLYGVPAAIAAANWAYYNSPALKIEDSSSSPVQVQIAISIGLSTGVVSSLYSFIEGVGIRNNGLIVRKLASLPGKLISLPIEGALKLGELTGRAYKGFKNYFHSVGKRARARRNGK